MAGSVYSVTSLTDVGGGLLENTNNRIRAKKSQPNAWRSWQPLCNSLRRWLRASGRRCCSRELLGSPVDKKVASVDLKCLQFNSWPRRFLWTAPFGTCLGWLPKSGRGNNLFWKGHGLGLGSGLLFSPCVPQHGGEGVRMEMDMNTRKAFGLQMWWAC